MEKIGDWLDRHLRDKILNERQQNNYKFKVEIIFSKDLLPKALSTTIFYPITISSSMKLMTRVDCNYIN